MDVRAFKLIKAVAETRSLTKAAERLFLSQSALSHQLKELESELETAVFYRASKKMVLTPVGERLLATAEVVLSEIDKVMVDVKRIVNGESGELRFSTSCYTCYSWLSPVVTKFSKRFPDVHVKVVAEATRNTLKHLADGAIDLAIMDCCPPMKGVQYASFLDDELVAILPAEHELGHLDHLVPDHFSNESLIMYNIDEEESSVLNDFLKPAGVRPKQILKMELTEAIVEMVKAKQGIAVLANWALSGYPTTGLAMTRLGTGLKRKWYAATLAPPGKNQTLDWFTESLRSTIPKLIDP